MGGLPYSATDLSLMLAELVDALVLELLPNGRRKRHEWCCGSIPGEVGDSLGVHLTGPKVLGPNLRPILYA